MRLNAFILIILFVLTGCTAESKETTAPEGEASPAKIELVPVDLFKGEAAKFQPFLGAMSGAFKLKYEGSKPIANLDINLEGRSESRFYRLDRGCVLQSG